MIADLSWCRRHHRPHCSRSFASGWVSPRWLSGPPPGSEVKDFLIFLSLKYFQQSYYRVLVRLKPLPGVNCLLQVYWLLGDGRLLSLELLTSLGILLGLPSLERSSARGL